MGMSFAERELGSAGFREAVERQKERFNERTRELQRAERERREPTQYRAPSTEEVTGTEAYRGIVGPEERPPGPPERAIPARTQRMLPADEFTAAAGTTALTPSGPLEALPRRAPSAAELASRPRPAIDWGRLAVGYLTGGPIGALRGIDWGALGSQLGTGAPGPSASVEREGRERPERILQAATGPGKGASTPGARAVPDYTSALDRLAPQYGYGGAAIPEGFVPGLPPGYAGIPENQYFYNPQTGEMISRPMQGAPQQLIPGAAPAGAPAAAGNVIDKILEAYGQDIPYLRGQPYAGAEEQAMIAQQKDRVRANYAMLRQQAMDEAGATGRAIAPVLRDLEQREAEDMGRIDQAYTVQAAQERRGRLGESRNLLAYLEQLDRARQMEALGIEQQLSEADRQAILDVLGRTGGVGANIGANILNYASGLGEQAQRNLATIGQNMGNLASSYYYGY